MGLPISPVATFSTASCPTRQPPIREFYAAIGIGDFEKAYSYFSTAYQSTNDKASWIGNEKFFQIKGATINSVKVTSVPEDKAIATVDVNVQDNTGTSRFLIPWHLVKEDGQWKLDEQDPAKKIY